MEIEKSLNMSLDDIINQQKKSRPVGSKKARSPQGIRLNSSKNAPLVRPGKAAGKGGARSQISPQNGKAKNKQALAPKKTAMHAIGKRQPQNRPKGQARTQQQRTGGKAKQQNAPKYMPQADNQAASYRNPPPTLRVTIDNPKAQRPVTSTQQSRPHIVMPGRQQFVVTNPVVRQGSAVRVHSPQYAPAAQPMDVLDSDGNYPVVPSRKSYANTAARPVNAASFLRDPYRGDDFERTSSRGMRSDGRYDGQSKAPYGDLMEDRYNPRASGATYARQSNRA